MSHTSTRMAPQQMGDKKFLQLQGKPTTPSWEFHPENIQFETTLIISDPSSYVTQKQESTNQTIIPKPNIQTKTQKNCSNNNNNLIH